MASPRNGAFLDQADAVQSFEYQDDDEQQQCSDNLTPSNKQVRFTNKPPSSSRPAIHDYYGGQSLNPRAGTALSSSPRSPLMKKFAPVQDRRVNTILLEALQLVEFTKDELLMVEKSVKRLRDAIHGFAILVDKQVNIIGAESLEERGRVKADIQDLCENLKTSNALLDSTCARMKKHLSTGKNQIHAHKRRLVGKAVAELVETTTTTTTTEACAAHQCSVNEAPMSPLRSATNNRALYGISVGSSSHHHSQAPGSAPRPSRSYGSPSSPGRTAAMSGCGGPESPLMSRTRTSSSRVPLAAILELTPPDPFSQHCEPQVYLSPEFFTSVSEAVGISEKEFFEPKDIVRFVHEMLTFSVARSGVLTFMGKAHHRQLIPKYAHELVRLILQELQPAPQSLSITSPTAVVPQNTLFDYMCTAPFRFNQLLHGLHVVNTSASDGTSYFTNAAASNYVQDPIDPLTGAGTNPFAEQFTRNGGVLNGSKVVNLVVPMKPAAAESELLETAEQTLSIAKLLHDLATAESEAKHGNRISIRPPASRSKEFSKAYIATSKELMLKETGMG